MINALRIPTEDHRNMNDWIYTKMSVEFDRQDRNIYVSSSCTLDFSHLESRMKQKQSVSMI